jgi:3-dehydroquinate synthase II
LSAKIVELKQIGKGARACIDTCDLMSSGEGVLVGCQSSGLFLIEAEVQKSPYVKPRPFRVNAGAISLYTLYSFNQTKYLSELEAGEKILIVNRKGETRLADVARVKIEWRPMILVEAEHSNKRIKVIVQNAETIRVVTPKGSCPITELKKDDEVLVHLSGGGRHFGTLVKKEKVIER